MSALSTYFNGQIAAWCLIFKRPDVAFEYWQKIIEAEPKHSRTLAKMSHQHAVMGRRAEAVDCIERALAIDSSNGPYWFNHGFMLQEGLRHAEALASFDRAIALDGKLDRAWYGKGLSLLALGREDEAIAQFRTVVKLQPMSPYGYFELVKCLARRGETQEAEKLMRRLKGFEPKWAAKCEDETGLSVGVDRWWVQ
jgi:tetratricopeptide (TPR) repeat protein